MRHRIANENEPQPAPNPSAAAVIENHHAQDRHSGLDLIRILSACGVIWFHIETTPFKEYRPGFISFVILAIILNSYGADRYSFSSFLRKRITRIMVPWAFWYAVYAVINLLKFGKVLPGTTNLFAEILAGPWIGLWFLPYILFVSLIIYIISIISRKAHELTLGSLFLAIGLWSFWLIFSTKAHHQTTPPWAQWLYAAPALPIGLAYTRYIRITNDRVRNLALSITPLTVLSVAVFFLHFAHGSWPYTIGTFLVSAAFLFKPRPAPSISKIAKLCMGAYLSHSVFLTLFRVILGKHYHYAPHFILTVIASFVFVGILRKYKWGRWVV